MASMILTVMNSFWERGKIMSSGGGGAEGRWGMILIVIDGIINRNQTMK